VTWSHQPGNITGDSTLLIILTHHWVSCPVRMAVTCYYHCDLKQMSSSSIPSSCSSCYHNHRPLPLLTISFLSIRCVCSCVLCHFLLAEWPLHWGQSHRWRWPGSLLVCIALMSCECNHAMCCYHTMMPLRFMADTIYVTPREIHRMGRRPHPLAELVQSDEFVRTRIFFMQMARWRIICTCAYLHAGF